MNFPKTHQIFELAAYTDTDLKDAALELSKAIDREEAAQLVEDSIFIPIERELYLPKQVEELLHQQRQLSASRIRQL